MIENIVFITVLVLSVGFSIYFYLDALKKDRRRHKNY